MSLSKMACFKTLAKPYPFRFQSPSSSAVFIRQFSFATPEEAAAERRKRKRRLRIEPPLSSLRHHQQQQGPSQFNPYPRPQNPNGPKLPEPVSALTGNRLNLHNKIVKLIRENDLEEAALYTRHSVYSNCRPTIYTCNAVMAALLRQQKYQDLLSFHRFITQAGIAANVVTYNILLTAYLDCRKTDIALEQYKLLIDSAPFNPVATTYRIMIKGLVDAQKVEKAVELKDDMYTKGYKPDPTVYSYLMFGLAKNSEADGILGLYEELKEKSGQEEVLDGVIYGNLMKGYFLKGMENEAMECYQKATREGTPIKMSVMAYNYVLEALSKNGKFDLALDLFDRMKNEYNPPTKLTLNLGSYNVVVDGYCAEKRLDKAIEVFNSMGEKNIEPDTLSYNVLIDQLCSNGMLNKGEELYKGMSDNKVNPDEYTFVVLMDTCFKENRPDDAAGYYRTMVESKLRPNVEVYNRLVDELVKFGKIDEAKSFFDMMVPKLRMRDDEYKFIMNTLLDVGRHDDVFEIVGRMLREEKDYTDELDEFLRERLSKDGREEEFTKLKEDIATEKAEAAARAAKEAEEAKAKSRLDLSSLKIFGKNANNLENKESQVGQLAVASGNPEASSASVNGEELAAQLEVAEEGSVEINFGDETMAEEVMEAKPDAETKQVTA